MTGSLSLLYTIELNWPIRSLGTHAGHKCYLLAETLGPVRSEHASLLRFLQEQNTSVAYLTAVCTGTLVLGAAGLLLGVAKVLQLQ